MDWRLFPPNQLDNLFKLCVFIFVTNLALDSKHNNNPQGGKETEGLLRPLQEKAEEKEGKEIGMQPKKPLAMA